MKCLSACLHEAPVICVYIYDLLIYYFLIACACHLSPASLSSSFSPYPSSPFSLRMLCVHVSYHDIITSPTNYIQLYYMCVCVCTCVCHINMYYIWCVCICNHYVLIIVDNGLTCCFNKRWGDIFYYH